MQTPGQRTTATVDGYFGWLPSWYTPGVIGYRNDQWYAVSTEFCIAGMGPSPDEAHRDLISLVDSYLRSFYEQGRPYEEARRPIGSLATLRLLLRMKRRKRLNLSTALPH